MAALTEFDDAVVEHIVKDLVSLQANTSPSLNTSYLPDLELAEWFDWIASCKNIQASASRIEGYSMVLIVSA